MDDVEPSAEECGHVLHEDDRRSKRANGVNDGAPQSAVGTGDPFAFAGVADVLVIPNSG